MRVVTVSQVRAALYWAAGGPAGAGEGTPTLPLLGRLFHQTFGALAGPDPAGNLVRPLEQADARLDHWKLSLRRHTYAQHVAPALVAHEAELRGRTAEVLTFWRAVQELADWLAELMWAQDPTARRLEQARADVFEGFEREVGVELAEPGWSEPVRLEGRLDALLRQPATGTGCVVELKTGRTAPDADLCQAALYRMLLAREGRDGPVAVVAFEPGRHEMRFEPERMRDAERALLALVGRLADVVPGATSALPASEPAAAALPSAAPGTDAVGTPSPADDAARSAHRALGRRLVEVLAELGLDLRLVGEPLAGPTFVRFHATPGRNLRARQLGSVAHDVWLRIPVERPPFISIVAGRIVLDVQRPDRRTVSWSEDVRPHLPAPEPAGTGRFPVGVAVDGTLGWADLADPASCHLLVAGTTGSGKSEWLRAMLASLLAANDRRTLRLVLIDPKRVAFEAFEGSPRLWRDVVYPDEQDAGGVLDELIDEMERRYRLGITDLRLHNATAGEPLPRIVCVCDEYADLLDGVDRKARRALELRIRRLGAKARGAGIHLVFATQRPSADVVGGTIRANLVARVALRVDSALNSRIVLEQPGAESLLGRGDLLFRSLGDPVRLQSPYVRDDELRALARS